MHIETMEFKVHLAGRYFEIVHHGQPRTKARKSLSPIKPIRKLTGEGLPTLQEKKALKNLKRARRKVMLSVNANLGPYTKWLTATYHGQEGSQDKVRAIQDIRNFKLALSRYLGEPVKMLYVFERQPKSNQLHWHAFLFNEPVISHAWALETWRRVIGGGNGTIRIGTLRSESDQETRVRYLTKYITKESIAEFGEHTYHATRNLEKPLVYHSDKELPFPLVALDFKPKVHWTRLFAYEGNIYERIEGYLSQYDNGLTWSDLELMGEVSHKRIQAIQRAKATPKQIPNEKAVSVNAPLPLGHTPKGIFPSEPKASD